LIAYAQEPSCPSCGREISEADARFCGGCGSALPAMAPVSPTILSAVDELDPQDARTRIGLERAGRSTISPGASVRAVGQTTRTRRSRRVGRPTAATHGGQQPSSYAAPRPVQAGPRTDLDLVASRSHDSPAPEPEPSPAPRRFDGDPFFEDVFRESRAPSTRTGDARPTPASASAEPPPVERVEADEHEELDVSAIQRARRTRALAAVGVAVAVVGGVVFLALQ